MDIQFWIDHSDSLFHQIFMLVMGGLYGIAYLFGTTYNVINILVYYFLIPSSWLYLIGRKTSNWINLVSLIAFLAFIMLPNLQDKCNYIFDKSVVFLNWSAKIFSSNYIDMSVYICVVIVAVVYLVLIPLTLPGKIAKIVLITFTVVFGLYMIIIYPNFKSIVLFGLKTMNIKH